MVKKTTILVLLSTVVLLLVGSMTVNAQTEWSEWGDSLPEEIDDTYEVEERTVYKYRDKSHTTGTNSSMTGWIKEKDPTVTWGTWSGWQDAAVQSSSTRQVETRQVGTGTYSYLDNPGAPNTIPGGRVLYAKSAGTLMSGSDVDWVQNFLVNVRGEGINKDGWYGKYTAAAVKNFQSAYGLTVDGQVGSQTASKMLEVWRDVTKTEIQKTQYRYRDSTTTYYWYKWSAWSEWSDEQPESKNDREIESKKQYRYRRVAESLEKAQISGIEAEYIYTGKEIRPQVIVSKDDKTLVEDEDYTVTCSDNINVGTALVIISGKGNYTGEKKIEFVIKKPQEPTTQEPTTQAPISEEPTTQAVQVRETASAGKVSLITMDEQEETAVANENGGTDNKVKIKKGSKSAQNKKVSKGTVFESSKATYKVSNTKKNTVTYISAKGKKTTAKVPDTIKYNKKEYKVTEIAPNAFKNNKKLKKIVIGKNVKKIGKNAFRGCKKLKSVTIGENVVSIGAYAFYGDKKLSTINFGTRKLNKVGKGAFKKISKHPTAKVPREKLYKYQKLIRKAS